MIPKWFKSCLFKYLVTISLLTSISFFHRKNILNRCIFYKLVIEHSKFENIYKWTQAFIKMENTTGTHILHTMPESEVSLALVFKEKWRAIFVWGKNWGRFLCIYSFKVNQEYFCVLCALVVVKIKMTTLQNIDPK